MPRTQLFLNRSHEKTDRQPDKGQNVSILDMLETAGQGWAESQPPGLFPLAGGGATPGNGATHNFTEELLGKPGGITQLHCVWLRPGTRHLPERQEAARVRR